MTRVVAEMRLWTVPRTVAATLLVGGLLVSAAPPPAPAAASERPAPAAPREFRVLEFNICGSMCNHGVVEASEPHLLEHVRDVILEARAHIVVLNEICGVQLERLYELLEDSGRPMHGAFHAQRNRDRHCPEGPGGHPFGDAVLSTGPVEPAEVHLLPNRPEGGEQRSILCLPTTVGIRLVACGLHLEAGQPKWNQRQFDEVVRQMQQRLDSETVVLAGDFNREPREMKALTDPKAGGAFLDVDAEEDRATHYNRRIDFILLDRRAFSDPSAEVHDSEWSDHRILIGRATLGPPE